MKLLYWSLLFCFQIGSTEWVEENLVNLGAKAVAYLNVDCAVQGPGFFAGATPQLDDILIEVTKMVSLSWGRQIDYDLKTFILVFNYQLA